MIPIISYVIFFVRHFFRPESGAGSLFAFPVFRSPPIGSRRRPSFAAGSWHTFETHMLCSSACHAKPATSFGTLTLRLCVGENDGPRRRNISRCIDRLLFQFFFPNFSYVFFVLGAGRRNSGSCTELGGRSADDPRQGSAKRMCLLLVDIAWLSHWRGSSSLGVRWLYFSNPSGVMKDYGLLSAVHLLCPLLFFSFECLVSQLYDSPWLSFFGLSHVFFIFSCC